LIETLKDIKWVWMILCFILVLQPQH
jgi:cbb3-type cytochrome oxidase subunit 3